MLAPSGNASSCPNGGGSLAVDSTHVYWAADQQTLKRVPVGGGTPDTLVSGPYVDWMATDATYLFFGSQSQLRRYKKVTKQSDVAGNSFKGTRIFVDAGYVYWFPYWAQNHTINRISVTASASETPSSIALGSYNASDLAFDTSYIYVVDGQGGTVLRVEKTAGTIATLASNLPQPFGGQPGHIAVNSTNVYWTDGQTVWKRTKAGQSSPTVVAKGKGTISFVPFVADDQFVFWVEDGYRIMRGPQ